MPTRPTPLPSVTRDQVAAFRLARHHLLDRAPRKALRSVALDMAGVQAQLPSAASISLWTRILDLRLEDVDRAMDARNLVKASCMRHTLFLVPSQHLAIFIRGTARSAQKEIRWARNKGVPNRTLDRAIEAVLKVLDRPLTRAEIAERVSRKLGVRTRSIQGGGWGSRRNVAAVPIGELTYPVVDLLHLVAARGVVCYGPYQGNEPTFVRADAWIPKWQDLSNEQAEDSLLRLYLAAYGPATVDDFAAWSGITLTEAREIWQREQSSLALVDLEGRTAAVLKKHLNDLERARLEHPKVRLLPYFDTFLLGHKERNHLMPAEHHPKVYRPQGWIAPVVLVDGHAAGVWEQIRTKENLLVRVRKFTAISRRVAAGIREEARDLGRFLGAANVNVQIN